MRKIYLIMAAMMMGILPSKAVDVLIDETCASWFEGYEMTKIYDFVNWTINGEPINDKPNEWTSASDAASFKVANWSGKGQATYQILSENLTHIYTMDPANVRPRESYGIFNFGNGRTLSFGDLKAGMIIVAQGGTTKPSKPYTNTYVSTTAEGICVEITDSIMAIQNAVDNDGDGVGDEVNDGFRYFKMLADGRWDLVFESGSYISAYGIIADASAKEFVTAPTMKLVGVAYDQRNIELKPGESSKGNEVTTWYSTNGDSPIYMEDTEEIARIDTIYSVVDENGVIDSTQYTTETIYVQKPVFDEEFGVWGDFPYVAEDGAFSISSEDDEDGDGYVTVKVASITDGGVMSDIVELNVSVGTITLNAPTLTLVGMDGTLRQYQLGWTNNTLCGEEFVINGEVGEGDVYEGMAVGDIIASKQSITLTVSAEGYEDGILTLDELENEGIEYTRKNPDVEHDWDFQYLPSEYYQKIKREILDYVYIVNEGGDTTKYTPEQVNSGEIEIPETAVEVYKDYNWWFDSGKGRATLNVQVDTIWAEDSTYTTNAYYKEEPIGLFHSGLTIDCPPNAKNNSCIFIYTDTLMTETGDKNRNDDLGVYFMSKATISIADLNYGEYVVTFLGKGGSDYTNSRWTECDMVPLEGFSKSLAASIHLFTIDVYSSENLPDAIDKVVGNEANFANVYSIDGRMVRRNANVGTALNGLHKGIYIMNGKKFLVK